MGCNNSDNEDRKSAPVLKLVHDAEKPTEDPTNRPGLNNPFVKMMSAWADQVDQDVKAILDL